MDSIDALPPQARGRMRVDQLMSCPEQLPLRRLTLFTETAHTNNAQLRSFIRLETQRPSDWSGLTSKCIATSNKCLTSSNKDASRNKCIASSN